MMMSVGVMCPLFCFDDIANIITMFLQKKQAVLAVASTKHALISEQALLPIRLQPKAGTTSVAADFPAQAALLYYEVTVRKLQKDGVVAIGLSARFYSKFNSLTLTPPFYFRDYDDTLPGFRSNSIALHSDNGNKYRGPDGNG